MERIIDDKSEHCVPFILKQLQNHRQTFLSKGENPPPFFIGLNGVQGAGKTTLVTTLRQTLSAPPNNRRTIVFSIDDLYLPHEKQNEIARSFPKNPLVQHRGQPSTHDIELGISLFKDISSRTKNIRVPSYDKSAFNGKGDRRPKHEWETLNREGEPPVEVVIFEGWCVGFRALSDDEVKRKWNAAKMDLASQGHAYKGRLGHVDLDSVLFINQKLSDYERITDQLAAFIHIDAEDAHYVYRWRLQQEIAMRATKGSGMTAEQVQEFVDGYYPAYELYNEGLRRGIYEKRGKQLRLLVGEDRIVKGVSIV